MKASRTQRGRGSDPAPGAGKAPPRTGKEPETSGAVEPQITVSQIPIQWDLQAGRVTFAGLPVVMAWIDTTLAGILSGVQKMVGTKRFALALQSEGRKSVEEDWRVISQFKRFEDGFAAIANIAAVAGWGRWELQRLDYERCVCVVRAYDGWEGRYQKGLGQCWGSAMLAGKFAGYCSKLFENDCWADQTSFIARGDAYDEFRVAPSFRSVETEIDNLLASGEATRADMAVALRRLQQESVERERAQESVRLFEDLFSGMKVGVHIYRLEDPDDDRSLRLIAANPASSEYTGLAATEIVNRRIDEAFPGLRERGLPQLYARLAISGRNFDIGDIEYGDARMKSAWFHVHAFGLPNRCVGASFDNVTTRHQMESDVLRSRSQLRRLARHMEAMREEERTAIAREVHEGIGQLLVALRLRTGALVRDTPALESSAHFGEMAAIVDQCFDAVRQITTELNPPELEHLGLHSAARAELGRFQERTRIAVTSVFELDDETLSHDMARSIFRTLQVCLSNVEQHAAASTLRVHTFADEHEAVLEVSDDGRGFDPGQPSGETSYGFVEMRERALSWGGRLDIQSRPGEGTRVRMALPI
jgi:signal transduction histidine kinase